MNVSAPEAQHGPLLAVGGHWNGGAADWMRTWAGQGFGSRRRVRQHWNDVMVREQQIGEIRGELRRIWRVANLLSISFQWPVPGPGYGP